MSVKLDIFYCYIKQFFFISQKVCTVGKMLSIKILCFLTILSLASLLPGKKGKMYLMEVESEKKSANSLPGSKINSLPRTQNKAFTELSPYFKTLFEAMERKPYMVYRKANYYSCVYRNGKKIPSDEQHDCNECVCLSDWNVECTNIDCENTETIHLCKDCLRELAGSVEGYMDWYEKLTSNNCRTCLGTGHA